MSRCKVCRTRGEPLATPDLCEGCHALVVAAAGEHADAQGRIARAVAARGYRAGWTLPQFLGRQLAKAVEEAAELVRAVRLTRPGSVAWHGWLDALRRAGEVAREAFDGEYRDEQGSVKIREPIWDHIAEFDEETFKAEAPDVIIPLLVAADAIGFDLIGAAVAKAEADIARGVRAQTQESEL